MCKMMCQRSCHFSVYRKQRRTTGRGWDQDTPSTSNSCWSTAFNLPHLPQFLHAPISLLKSWSMNSPITGVFALILSVNDPQQTHPEESSDLLDSLNPIKLIRQTITYELHQQNVLILTRYRIWPANTIGQEPECTGWLVLSFVSAEVVQHGVFQS